MTLPSHQASTSFASWRVFKDKRLTLAATLSCIALLTWIFRHSALLAPEMHADYTWQLRDLRELDSVIDGELLANRLELVRNYDALSEQMAHALKTVELVRALPEFLEPDDRGSISHEADSLARTLRHKAELVERFKRDNAILRNSLAYFPMAAEKVLAHPVSELPPDLRQPIEYYVRQMLMFSRSPSQEGRSRIVAQARQLKNQPHDVTARLGIDNLLQHGEQIVLYLLDQDRLIQEIFTLGSHQQIENLFLHYSRAHDQGAIKASRYRDLLYTVAVVLAAFLAWLFIRLERTRQSLSSAHAELSARYAAQLAVEKQLILHATAFHNAHDGIFLTDAKGNILDVNPAFTRITGWARDEVIGHNPRLFKSGKHDETFYRAMWESIGINGSWHGEIWNRSKSGEIHPELLSVAAVQNADRQLSNYVAVFADIRRIKAQERELTQLAYYDALTELPNRVLLADRFKQAIAQARRSSSTLAICYLDLDSFKPINDTWGHLTGDKVLIEIGRRLQSALRGGDTVARLGGDEFVLLLQGINSEAEILDAANRILRLISAPLAQVPDAASISASMGITLFPDDDADPDTLLRHADQAMYYAKEAGKNTCHIFDTEQSKFKRSRQDRRQRIEQALENHEFVLYYQSKVNLKRGTLIGAEALIRWQHPELGLLPPADFLPLIENDDLIKLIGDWVIEAALAQMEAWKAQGFTIPVSVNIAARQLQAPEFVEKLKAVLFNHPNVARQLELEILETAALEDIVKSARIIDECRQLGVRFALDDFGTGYSSLTYLKRLPTETIKIDQSFVGEILNDSHSLNIVHSVIGLARSLRREVIAEGVESVEHGRILIQLGCEHAQGYGIAKPMPGHDLFPWSQQWKAPDAWRAISDIRWHDAVYPMLIAEVVHRNWVEQIAFALEHNQPPPHSRPHDYHHCQLGQWLENEGSNDTLSSRLPAFLALDEAHRRIHDIANMIDRHWRDGKKEQTQSLLSELWVVWDEVQAALHALQIESSTVASAKN